MDISFTAEDLMGDEAVNAYPWSDEGDAIKSFLMVGALPDSYDNSPLCANDQKYLRNFLALAAQFKVPVARAFNIVSSNLYDGEDFLRDYGLYYLDSETPPAPVDAVIFCYLYFGYGPCMDPLAPHARQSPFADSGCMWSGALKQAQPKAMLNVSGYDELPTRFLNEPPYRHVFEDGKNHFLVRDDLADALKLKTVPDTSTHYADGFSSYGRGSDRHYRL